MFIKRPLIFIRGSQIIRLAIWLFIREQIHHPVDLLAVSRYSTRYENCELVFSLNFEWEESFHSILFSYAENNSLSSLWVCPIEFPAYSHFVKFEICLK